MGISSRFQQLVHIMTFLDKTWNKSQTSKHVLFFQNLLSFLKLQNRYSLRLQPMTVRLYLYCLCYSSKVCNFQSNLWGGKYGDTLGQPNSDHGPVFHLWVKGNSKQDKSAKRFWKALLLRKWLISSYLHVHVLYLSALRVFFQLKNLWQWMHNSAAEVRVFADNLWLKVMNWSHI